MRDIIMIERKSSFSIATLTKVFDRACVDKRATMFVNTLRRLPDPSAKSFLINIQAIWTKERFKLSKFIDPNSPDPGLLRALGYHVGVSVGLATEHRRMILDYLLESEALPPIKDEAYMAQWGNPGSTKRRDKLFRVLKNLIEEKKHDIKFNKAVSEWADDFVYIFKT